MVTIHLESAVVPEPLGRRALPPEQGKMDTTPAMEGFKPQDCSQEQSSPQAWLLFTTSVHCWPLLETGCWLGGPLPGAAQPCLGFYDWCSKICDMAWHDNVLN